MQNPGRPSTLCLEDHRDLEATLPFVMFCTHPVSQRPASFIPKHSLMILYLFGFPRSGDQLLHSVRESFTEGFLNLRIET